MQRIHSNRDTENIDHRGRSTHTHTRRHADEKEDIERAPDKAGRTQRRIITDEHK